MKATANLKTAPTMGAPHERAPARGRGTAAAAILREAAAAGITHFFGIPGGALAAFLSALASLTGGVIRSVLAGHEIAAGSFAEGAARGTGRIQGCYVTAGPGVAHLVAALHSARANQIPMLVIAGEPPLAHWGRDPAQALDAVRLLDNRELTKACERLLDPRRAAERVRYLLHVAQNGIPGPVVFVLPADVGLAEVDIDALAPVPSFDRRDGVELILNAYERKQSIGILVGSGAALSGAGPACVALAETLHCPLATTARAKSTVPETHRLAVGPWGFASTDSADAAVGDRAQLLLVVGSGAGELATGGYDPRLATKRILQIDARPERLGANLPLTVGIAGDARRCVEWLVGQLTRAGLRRKELALPIADPGKASVQPAWLDTAGMHDDTLPLKPQRVMGLLNELVPARVPYFCDIGNTMMYAINRLVRTEPNTFHWDGHSGRMGHSTAGIGAAIATGRPVVILTGDAALKMVMGEIHTAAEYRAPAVIVVLNDSGHGMVCAGMKAARLPSPDYRYGSRVDFAKVAAALGARAFTIETAADFAQAMQRALRGRGPTVLDVLVDPRETPPMEKRLRALRGETAT